MLSVDVTMAVSNPQSRREIESQLILNFNELAKDEKDTLFENLKAIPGITFCGMEKRDGVRFYFFCETLEALTFVREILDFGDLKDWIDLLFEFLLDESETGPVRSGSLNLVNFCQCVDYITKG